MEEVEGLRGVNFLNIKEAHEAGRKSSRNVLHIFTTGNIF